MTDSSSPPPPPHTKVISGKSSSDKGLAVSLTYFTLKKNSHGLKVAFDAPLPHETIFWEMKNILSTYIKATVEAMCTPLWFLSQLLERNVTLI